MPLDKLRALGEIRLLRANKLLVPVTARRGRVSRRVYLETDVSRRDARFAASSLSVPCASVNQRGGRRRQRRPRRSAQRAILRVCATISSASIYDDEVTRVALENAAVECERLRHRNNLFSLSNFPRTNFFYRVEKKRTLTKQSIARSRESRKFTCCRNDVCRESPGK